jgi:hypothetical protein
LNNLPLSGWRYDFNSSTEVAFTGMSWFAPEWWYWDFGDPASGALNNSTQTNPVHHFSAPGAYEVCLTVGNPYGSDTHCKTIWITTVGTRDAREASGVLNLYPNPSSGLVYFTEEEALQVRVFDGFGRLLLERLVTEKSLDLSHLPGGLYHMQAFREGGLLATQNLVIMPH